MGLDRSAHNGSVSETTPLTATTSEPDGGVERQELVTANDASSREAHLDNVKFFLMCVVVWNHCIQDFFKFLEPKTGRAWCAPDAADTVAFGGAVDLTRVARGFYLYLNLLGMPAFTAVSVYCSRGWARDVRLENGSGMSRRYRSAVESLLVPWMIWQPFYVVYNYRYYPIQLWSPIGVTWYLTSLFFWRASVSVFGQVNRKALLPFLFVLGIAVGFTETPETSNGLAFLDFQRSVAFLPVFYAGMTLATPERFARAKSAANLGWAVTAAAAVTFTAMIQASAGGSGDGRGDGTTGMTGGYCFDEIQRYLWMTTGYENGGSAAAPLTHAAYRTVFYAAACVVTVAFVAIVPAERKWYTSYGSRTMYAYLLHLVVVRGLGLMQESYIPESNQPPLWGRAILYFVALPLLGSVGLMTPLCSRMFAWVVEPAKAMGGKTLWGFWAEGGE